MLDDSILEINFWYINVDSLNVEFLRGYNRYRSELVFPMLPLLPACCGSFVESASGLACLFVCLFVCFFHQNWSPEEVKKDKVLLVENLTPFVSPWRPLQGVCLTQGSFGIQTTRTLSLLFSTAAGNWICRYLFIRCLGL